MRETAPRCCLVVSQVGSAPPPPPPSDGTTSPQLPFQAHHLACDGAWKSIGGSTRSKHVGNGTEFLPFSTSSPLRIKHGRGLRQNSLPFIYCSSDQPGCLSIKAHSVTLPLPTTTSTQKNKAKDTKMINSGSDPHQKQTRLDTPPRRPSKLLMYIQNRCAPDASHRGAQCPSSPRVH